MDRRRSAGLDGTHRHRYGRLKRARRHHRPRTRHGGGDRAGPNQPDFSLQATIDGRWDDQYKKIAKAILDYRDVVLIRFAHEMNGNWYPWGIANGNKAGQYAEPHCRDVRVGTQFRIGSTG